MIERQHMGRREVADVDVVADASPVRRWVIVPKDGELGARSRSRLGLLAAAMAGLYAFGHFKEVFWR